MLYDGANSFDGHGEECENLQGLKRNGERRWKKRDLRNVARGIVGGTGTRCLWKDDFSNGIHARQASVLPVWGWTEARHLRLGFGAYIRLQGSASDIGRNSSDDPYGCITSHQSLSLLPVCFTTSSLVLASLGLPSYHDSILDTGYFLVPKA